MVVMPVTFNSVGVGTSIYELVSFQVLELHVTLVFLNENTSIPLLLCTIFSAELFFCITYLQCTLESRSSCVQVLRHRVHVCS